MKTNSILGVGRSMLAAALLTAFISPIASAEIYRWTDADGVVNYSNTKPEGVKAQLVQEGQISVNTLPKTAPEDVRALNDRLTNRRIQQLESELAAERQRAPVVVTEPEVGYGGGSTYYPTNFGGGFGAGRPENTLIHTSTSGDNRTTTIQRYPTQELRPGIAGVGGQIVPVTPPPTPGSSARYPGR